VADYTVVFARWLKKQGSLAEIEKKNIAKAKLLYDFLNVSSFFKNSVRKSDRSRMNIPFTLADPKGHRAVGGMRASIYNAMPIEGVKRLVEYLREFEAKRG
jgi:phosphoserine aminotransferase